MLELAQRVQKVSEHYFRPELSLKLHRRAKEMPLIGCLSAFTLATLFSSPYIHGLLQLWSLLSAIVCVVGHYLLFRKQSKPDYQTYIRWNYIFIAFFVVVALLWSTFAVMVFPTITEWQEVCLLLILFTVASVPLPVLVLCFPITIIYPAIILTVAITMFVLTHGHFDSHIALGITLYLCALTYIYKQTELARHLVSDTDANRRLTSSIMTIEKLEHDRYHDAVTGLFNLSGLSERIQLLKREGQGCFCIFALKLEDVDDLYASHSKGFTDGVIQAAADRLRQKKAPHTVLAHQGLGEFILLTPNDLRPQLSDVAEKILAIFDDPISTPEGFLTLSISLGSAIFPVDSDDESQIINCALAAMREAGKDYGTRFTPYHQTMSHNFVKRIGLRTQIPNAIRNNEFALYLQPKVTVSTGRIESAEALIRWVNPELGLISPGDFIPISESTGDIIPLGRWVIDEAFRLLQDSRLPETFSIAINISAKQFADPELLGRLKYVASHLTHSTRKLELEITESVLVTENYEVRAKLLEISKMGFSIALDDFGTGYSSLSYLSRLEADTLKLDKSFIDPIPKDERHSALVSSVINMAAAMDMTLVAEGVTSYEQLAWLAQNQCEVAQGFLFAKPLPFEQFIDWLEEKRSDGHSSW